MICCLGLGDRLYDYDSDYSAHALGCWIDQNKKDRIFTGGYKALNGLPISECDNYCKSQGSTHFGNPFISDYICCQF